MSLPEPRSAAQRKTDTLALLEQAAIDVWVATASVNRDGSARAHLVPLSLGWIDERLVVAIEADSLTARNLAASRQARVALGGTRDVVMIDATLEDTVDVTAAPDRLGERYAAQADWDPRKSGEGMLFVTLRPMRIQAWREVNELTGRTLMRNGAWAVE